MSANKRQHVVPRFYLAMFSDDQGATHVWVRTTDKRFKANPAKIGIESDCYSVGEPDRRDMSADHVNTAVESWYAEPLKALASSALPTNRQWQAIWVWTASLLTRSCHTRDAMTSQLQRLTDLLDSGAEKCDGLQEVIVDAITAIRRTTEVHHAATVGGGLLPMLDELKYKPCTLLIAPTGCRFITSDDPPIITRDEQVTTLSIQPGSIADDHVNVVLPIKPEIACRWGGGTSLSVRQMRVAEVEKINGMTRDTAYRQVYAAHPTDLQW